MKRKYDYGPQLKNEKMNEQKRAIGIAQNHFDSSEHACLSDFYRLHCTENVATENV